MPKLLHSHSVVDVENVTLTIPPQYTVTALVSCNLSVAIGVSIVDVCGRYGARAEVALKDVLHDIGKCPSQTSTASQTTAESQPDSSTCTCRLINAIFFAMNSVCLKSADLMDSSCIIDSGWNFGGGGMVFRVDTPTFVCAS